MWRRRPREEAVVQAPAAVRASVSGKVTAFVAQLIKGIMLVKYSRQGTPKQRMLYVKPEAIRLHPVHILFFLEPQMPAPKPKRFNKPRSRKVADLIKIMSGTEAAGFRTMSGAVIGDHDLCFSLVFQRTRTKIAILSLQAVTTTDFQTLIQGFQAMIDDMSARGGNTPLADRDRAIALEVLGQQEVVRAEPAPR